MIQAIGYVRRSSDRQEESLDQQRSKLETFANSRGWKLVHVYVDDAISGSDMDRPGLRQLLDRAAKDGQIEAVVAWDRNRLARPKDPMDGMALERQIRQAGKRIFYVATGQEPNNSFASGLMGFVEHYQNGDYLRKLSRDVARGILAKVRRGRWPGGPIPFGYDRLFVGTDGTPRRIVRLLNDGSHQVIDAQNGEVVDTVAKGQHYRKQAHEECTLIPSEPARVRAVQKIFADFAVGVPTRRIHEELNAAGFRTSASRMFLIDSLNVILQSPTYLGRCVYNRRTLSKWHRLIDGSSIERQDEGIERRPESDWVVVEDAWPALVDQDVFDRVQERRAQSREHHRHTTGSAVRSEYLLTKLSVCGVCGSRLIGQTTTSGKAPGPRYRSRYYVCGTHHRGNKELCPKRNSVPADLVESHILGLIETDLRNLRDDDRMHAHIAEELTRLSGGRSDAAEQLQRRQAELDQQAAKLRDHLLAMDPQTAQTMGIYDQAKRVAEEKRQVDRRLGEIRHSQPQLPSEDQIKVRAMAAFEDFERVIATGLLEEKRELISLYVQKIEADPDRQTVVISLYPEIFSWKIGVSRDLRLVTELASWQFRDRDL